MHTIHCLLYTQSTLSTLSTLPILVLLLVSEITSLLWSYDILIELHNICNNCVFNKHFIRQKLFFKSYYLKLQLILIIYFK